MDNKLIQTSLFRHKSFRLPGIGTLSIVTNAAETDYVNLTIKSPVHTIIFTEDQQAANLFNKFSSTSEFVTTSLEETGSFHLNGVGTFTKTADKIRFLGVALSREFVQPVKAERVSKHTAPQRKVVVKETPIKIATAPDIIVEETVLITKKRSYWWVWAIGLSIAAAAIIFVYFSQNPGSLPSFGNNNPINAAPASTGMHHEIK
ncbi:MAG TPA: hypothetical protein VK559_11225 [Ferruginibacter sp.]|nr:hypothetical protein [Ferruginibacter sp.]